MATEGRLLCLFGNGGRKNEQNRKGEDTLGRGLVRLILVSLEVVVVELVDWLFQR